MESQKSGIGKALELTVSRGYKTKSHCAGDFTNDYSGVHYTNRLLVDRPIRLTGFTFFAPVIPGYTEYSVVVRKMRGHEIVAAFQVSKSKAELQDVTNQRIRINPPQQIPIEANVWYDVKFRIDGPETPYLEDKLVHVVVYPIGYDYDAYAPGDKTHQALATFQFFTGSGQLPEYHFVLA